MLRSPAEQEDHFVAAMRALGDRYASGPQRGARERPTDLETIEKAQQYFRQRVLEPVPLTAVARRCGVSRYQLIRLFQRVVGVSPHAYLVQLRVNRAQTMLSRGALPASVAFDCGFSDQSYLTRTFKRCVGVPPGQYVRSVRRDH